MSFNPNDYALVADRIALFCERYLTGRNIPRLHAVTDKAVILEALVYRDRGDPEPAATGWAREFEGDGKINQWVCPIEEAAKLWGDGEGRSGAVATRESRSEAGGYVRERRTPGESEHRHGRDPACSSS